MNQITPATRYESDADAYEPSYLRLHATGALAARAAAAREHLRACDLCARYCRVDRLASLRGVACRTGAQARVASYFPHFGEEDVLRGHRGGSGTIFFSWCNLRCGYCQNFEVNIKGEGGDVTAERLAEMMLELQAAGCHNINFVSPSHVVAQLLEALPLAVDAGLRLPLVYNTGGFDSAEALALLDGIIDIYLPDMKYGDSEIAHELSHIRGYAAVNQAVVREMHRQVGDLVLDRRGIAQRGLLVRHLVLPGGLAGTAAVARFVAEQVSPATWFNLMDQYAPAYKAVGDARLGRRVPPAEYRAVLQQCRAAGLTRLDPSSLAAARRFG